MRLTRTPLRVTLGGGGSDLGDGGVCIAAAIDKYVTIAVSDSFDDSYLLKYSAVERAHSVSEIKHRILRAAIDLTDTAPGVEITSIADIPAGTGLGSSGAFTVGVLHALAPRLSRPGLAALACRIDTGQQDQWAAVYGGVNCFDFAAETIRPIETRMDDHLALYYTGTRRHEDTGPAVPPPAHHVADAALALQRNDPFWFGQCLTLQWTHKLGYADTAFHRECDDLIRVGCEHGALGGKLVGAGGGGFLLFVAWEADRLDDAMKERGLRRVPFRFDHTGTTLL